MHTMKGPAGMATRGEARGRRCQGPAPLPRPAAASPRWGLARGLSSRVCICTPPGRGRTPDQGP